MNIIDMIIAVVICFSLYRGYQKGLIQTGIGLVGWFVSLYFAARYAQSVAPLFDHIVSAHILQVGLAFISLILLMLTMLWGLETVLKTLIKNAHLTWLEHIGGGILGAAKGVLIVLVIISTSLPFVQNFGFWRSSTLATALAPYAPAALKFSRSIADSAWHHLIPADEGSNSNAEAVDTHPSIDASTKNGKDDDIENAIEKAKSSKANAGRSY